MNYPFWVTYLDIFYWIILKEPTKNSKSVPKNTKAAAKNSKTSLQILAPKNSESAPKN